MKNKLLTLIIGATVCLIIIPTERTCAQFKTLVNKAKAVITGGSSVNTGNSTSGEGKKTAKIIDTASDFQAGDSVMFRENFSTSTTGSLPVSWKTNGSGKVIGIVDIPGKWLQLENGATYKLSRLINLPSKFSIEFDVVAVADQITDLDPLIFGCTVNNSIKSYVQDAYNNGGLFTTSLMYFNKNEIVVSSSKTKAYLSTKYDLEGCANRVMHVAIAADGDHVNIYLDKTKITDTKLFNNDMSKYFFISAPLSSKNNAAIAIGNFEIKTFKKQ